MIGVINYGTGNIRSVANALQRLGVEFFVSNDAVKLSCADKLIFPGVGEARHAMDELYRLNLVDWIKQVQVPFLGICLGMQLLFERSVERETECLGLIPGTVQQFCVDKNQLKVPHMGWNQIQLVKDDPLFSGIHSGEFFYFVHSYYVPITAETIAQTEYGISFASAVRWKNFRGVQFHPEKSSKEGLHLLKNFIELC